MYLTTPLCLWFPLGENENKTIKVYIGILLIKQI